MDSMNALKIRIRIVSLFLLFSMMNGCMADQEGERFGIGIVGRISEPKLEYGILVSGDQKIRVKGVNAGIDFGSDNEVRIPDEIEFFWRAVGEKVPHSAIIKLREQIPGDVLQKIKGHSTTHYFSVEFFVLNNKPYFRWKLVDILPENTGNFKEISRGGHW